MASGVTNRGKYLLLGYTFVGTTLPTNYYLALATSATTPDVDTNTFSDLTEIAAGNGYTTGGFQLSPGAVDFDVHTEDDTNNRALIQVKDVIWTAAGGPIPASGDGARWAVLLDDNATIADRQIIAWFDLVSDRSVVDGLTLTLKNCETRANTP
jgi:hypothetical protein